MDSVFIYWDNSNIFHEAQRIAEERNGGPDARYRVRINFDNMLRLAHADRPIGRVCAAGSVTPSMQRFLNRLEGNDVDTHLFMPDNSEHVPQEVAIRNLQLNIMEDAVDHLDSPSTAVLVTGDGSGYLDGAKLYRTFERLHKRDWRIEVVSWKGTCNQRMREWAQENGVFVALDDFYESVTFMEPSRPGHQLAQSRESAPLDLSLRAMA